MKQKKVIAKQILNLENMKAYNIANEFGCNLPLPGYIWKLLFYKEITEYLEIKKEKKTVTVNV